MQHQQGKISRISGPLVVAEGKGLLERAHLYDVVRVGPQNLMGEVIKIEDGKVFVQVYEETSGLRCGDAVETDGLPLAAELGPGLMSAIFDGIQRPLQAIAEMAKSPFITRGIQVPSLDRNKKWDVKPVAKKGDRVSAGDVLATVRENDLITHKILVPVGIEGSVKSVKGGDAVITDAIAEIETAKGVVPVAMLQRWPIRQARPYAMKIRAAAPLITGQRVIDTYFPMLKGGTGCTPGPFGSGKTVIQHQIAKWSDAEIIVYIGCGERGNEMTDALTEFPELKDPKSGKSLMNRTIMIANTSNMPVAAREASIYTGMTIAEYYRDMGYNVALMADSTSRWAEALREISGRLEEMPGEEGYPSYLGSRTAAFYERAGTVKTLGGEGREASLTAIGAVSPAGGDLSEPVTTNTLRVTKVFWGLDADLAYKRHYPAINWLTSYSLYTSSLDAYFRANVHPDFITWRDETQAVLQREAQLQEIVRLVGVEALSVSEQFLLNVAKALREDYLQQNAFDDTDSYCSPRKQSLMLGWLHGFYVAGVARLEADPECLSELAQDPFFAHFSRAKYETDEALLAAEYVPAALRQSLSAK